MTNTERLKELINKSGYKLEYLAEKCGITRQSLSNKIVNRNLFNAKEIDILCKELGISNLEEKESIFFADEVE
jgi:transcriptional regulator with XRE-family HTH domain